MVVTIVCLHSFVFADSNGLLKIFLSDAFSIRILFRTLLLLIFEVRFHFATLFGRELVEQFFRQGRHATCLCFRCDFPQPSFTFNFSAAWLATATQYTSPPRAPSSIARSSQRSKENGAVIVSATREEFCHRCSSGKPLLESLDDPHGELHGGERFRDSG